MDILQQLLEIESAVESFEISNVDDAEQFRIAFLGSKNRLKPISKQMGQVPPEQRKDVGLSIKRIKDKAQERYDAFQSETDTTSAEGGKIDLTLPGQPVHAGSRHPVQITMSRLVEIFRNMGFVVAEEREIEDDWHNFSAMNTPEDHPARDMQDTFYLMSHPDRLLRTHTSSVQSRIMESYAPPIRIIAPGRVYRNETVSARSHCQFHQIEGLYIDKGVSFADMRQTLFSYARALYGQDVVLRLRPSYFPFTEPSAEMDVYWGLETEDDYRITKGTGWLEVLGCGMVDPQVLTNCGIDPEQYSGFAFGMGVERQAMQQFKINDIRMLFENDVRFLSQFAGL